MALEGQYRKALPSRQLKNRDGTKSYEAMDAQARSISNRIYLKEDVYIALGKPAVIKIRIAKGLSNYVPARRH